MNYFRSFDGGSATIKGVKTLYFSCAGTFPQFSAGHRNLPLYPRPNCLLRERQYSCLHRIMCDFQSTLGVSLLWKHSCTFLLMVLFLWSIITDWQDENKRTKKLGSQIWENLCSLYSNKCLRLASEKFVLASGSNLSLATGLASWQVSLKPWLKGVVCFKIFQAIPNLKPAPLKCQTCPPSSAPSPPPGSPKEDLWLANLVLNGSCILSKLVVRSFSVGKAAN